jgi:NAD+ kinase
MGGNPVKFGITANPQIPDALSCAKKVVAWLEKGQDVFLESDLARAVGRKGMPLAHMKVDVMLAIGGDGTILRALQLSDAKVLGINSGSLGFLAEVNAEEATAYLERTIRGEHTVEERMRLKVTVNGQRMFDCTNEAVIHTAQIAKIRPFEIRLGEELVERVRADGIIVATPTGSTSYSMSAGGPIVDPRVDAIIVTAIAPFKPGSRPHVFPAQGQVHVRLTKPKECLLVMDGQHESSLKGTEDVVLTASERRAKFIRFRSDFYRRVEEKLSRQ